MAVIDSGFSAALEDSRVDSGVAVSESGVHRGVEKVDDSLGHGTLCALTVLSLAPKARIVPVKIFGSSLDTSPRRLIMALQVAMDMGADVINLSLASRLEIAVPALYRACEMAMRANVVVVCAAMNGTNHGYPAVFDNVIGVQAGRTASLHDYHYRRDHELECLAGGALHPGGSYTTSYAAAVISGITSALLAPSSARDLETARILLERNALT